MKLKMLVLLMELVGGNKCGRIVLAHFILNLFTVKIHKFLQNLKNKKVVGLQEWKYCLRLAMETMVCWKAICRASETNSSPQTVLYTQKKKKKKKTKIWKTEVQKNVDSM